VASTVWKGHLSFGLVSFAVRLTRAARKERIPLRYVREQPRDELSDEDIPPRENRSDFSRDDHSQTMETASEAAVSPVRQTYVPVNETHPVPTDQLQRAYEVSPGRFAVVGSEELRRLRQPTSTEMQNRSLGSNGRN
jgi:non-homologous end joining protein Ku